MRIKQIMKKSTTCADGRETLFCNHSFLFLINNSGVTCTLPSLTKTFLKRFKPFINLKRIPSQLNLEQSKIGSSQFYHNWNNNNCYDWRRTYHVSWVKTHKLLDLNVSLVFASGNIEVLEEIKLTLSLGPVIKCLP